MPAPWIEWAYDTSQNVPAQLVSRDSKDIDALVTGSYSDGTYRNGAAPDLNTLDVYPVTRIDDPHGATDVPDPAVVSYAAEGGGLVYEIHQTYTPVVVPPPSLGDVKIAALGDAEFNSIAFLNGGFFYDDGGGADLYDSEPEIRSLYAEIGVEANAVGGSFMVDIRDAGSVNHSLNDVKWHEAYTEFFNHIIQAKEELDAARIEIAVAGDEAAVQAALDAMSPPNNTI